MVFESFGFKYGVPHDADFIFDTRFLPNPYWIPELRPYSGLDQPVIDYLGAQEEVSAYINQIFTFLRNWLPMIERSSRSYLTVALGCTGGYHRSVYTAEQLAKRFRDYNKVVRSGTLRWKSCRSPEIRSANQQASAAILPSEQGSCGNRGCPVPLFRAHIR